MMILTKKMKKVKKSVDIVENICYIINALGKKPSKIKKSSLKTEQNVNLSSRKANKLTNIIYFE